jgi:putative Mg2+ transporter-C (MgtC) family protein
MELQTQAEIFVYLLLAALLSAIIGMDRQRRYSHTAGLRTHMLVGVGSCLFTGLSIHAFPGSEGSRVASNVVVGIGFLGAGVIIERREGIRNLTTAASIWVTAAMGMAVGAGAWFLAMSTAALVWIILAVIRRLENKAERRATQEQPRVDVTRE